MIDSKTAGSRYATRVRIASPGGSVYDGIVGMLVRIEGDTAYVRLHPNRLNSIVVPFALSEIKEINLS